MLPWLRRIESAPEIIDEDLEVICEDPAEEPLDEKEEPPVVLTREYCSNCINSDGEIICPRRHRCRTCKCYLDDDEWFAQFKK